MFEIMADRDDWDEGMAMRGGKTAKSERSEKSETETEQHKGN